MLNCYTLLTFYFYFTCVCVFIFSAKTAVNRDGPSQCQQPLPLCDLQFEDLSILERRTSSDVPSVAGPFSIFTE